MEELNTVFHRKLGLISHFPVLLQYCLLISTQPSLRGGNVFLLSYTYADLTSYSIPLAPGLWCVTLCSLFIHYLLDFSCFFPLNPSTVWECYWTLTSSVSPPWLGRWAWLIVTLMFVKISETRKKCLLSLFTTLLNKKRLSVFLVFVLVFGVLFFYQS